MVTNHLLLVAEFTDSMCSLISGQTISLYTLCTRVVVKEANTVSTLPRRRSIKDIMHIGMRKVPLAFLLQRTYWATGTRSTGGGIQSAGRFPCYTTVVVCGFLIMCLAHAARTNCSTESRHWSRSNSGCAGVDGKTLPEINQGNCLYLIEV